ncbi:MAG TPA: hypothetical protein VHJ20_21140 [Polyangia bacterium]|nr:hypothetical protein [Polyangia bacterium]
MARSLLRLARAAAFVVACGVFAVAVWYAWAALDLPLETEIREGSAWMLVLAKRAGVDIYDTSRSAFVNMNHGPMDPLLKGWIAEHAPWLPGHTVVRIFVFLMPFFFLGAAYHVGRRSWTEALLAAGAFYLLLADITNMTVVGRSDATFFCALAVGLSLTHALLVNRHQNWTNLRYVALQVAFGACGAVMFLTVWRIFPTIGVMVLLTFAKQVTESSYRFWRTAISALVLYTAGFALVWIPVFVLELHADFSLYYQRFFGFFTHESGWGTFPCAQFRLFPIEMYEPRVGLALLLGGLVVTAFYRLRRERAQLVVWLLMLPTGWAVYAYAFYANGGGVHYFCPFVPITWFLIVHALRRRGQWRPVAQVVVAGLFVWVYPWKPLFTRGEQLRALAAESRTFLKQVDERVGSQPVLGENSHLYKRWYRAEVIDSGDAVDAINGRKYYGEVFSRTYHQYLDDLVAHPPKFVMSAALNAADVASAATPRLTQLLRERYRLAIAGPSTFIANGSGGTNLYERKDD